LDIFAVQNAGLIFEFFARELSTYTGNRMFSKIANWEEGDKKGEAFAAACKDLIEHEKHRFSFFLCWTWNVVGQDLGTWNRWQLAFFARRRGLSRRGHEVLHTQSIFMSETTYRKMQLEQIKLVHKNTM